MRNSIWLVIGSLAVSFGAFTACGGSDDGGGSGTGGSATGGGGSGGGGAGGTGGGGSGGTDGGGATGGSGGAAGNATVCAGLETEYATELEKARLCDANAGTNTCTEKVDNSLACPCSTYVSSDKSTELAKLNDLKTQWTNLNCAADIMCPAIACQEPTSGSCSPDPAGGTGRCRDTL